MAEDLRSELEESRREMRRQRDENLNPNPAVPTPGNSDSGSPLPDGETPAPSGNEDRNNPENPPAPPRPQRIPDGVSHAYDDINVEDFGSADKEKTKTNATSPKTGIKPPERKRGGGKSGGGKDIMEVFWNECIIALYEWTIDAVVDNTLDFAEWWLFHAHVSDGGNVETETDKNNKKDVFALGEEVFKKKMENPLKNKELFDKAHNELKENLSREASGAAAVWTVWGAEPRFYPRLKQIYNVAAADENSPEAKIMERFNKTPEIIQGILKKEEVLYKTAVRLATLEEALDKNKPGMPEDFNENLAALEQLLKNKDRNARRLKDNIQEKVAAMKASLGTDSAIHKEIAEKLKEIQEIAAGDSENAPKINKEVSGKLKNVKELSASVVSDPELIKKRIQGRSQQHYDKLMDNIDKIQEKYEDNPEMLKNASQEYLKHVTTNIKPAKEAIDAANGSSFGRKSSTRKKAEETVAKALSSLDNFVFEGHEIGSAPKAGNKSEFPLAGDKLKILRAVRDYSIGA